MNMVQPAPALHGGTAVATGTVVALMAPGSQRSSEHERAALERHTQAIATLLGWQAGGWHDIARPYQPPLYFVPNETLSLAQASQLGITGPDDLFGGVVPHAFVASKAISHPLVSPQADRPPGWNAGLDGACGDAVLAGYSAFSRDDAQAAARRLLGNGPVRIKPSLGTGGRGQVVAKDEQAVREALAAMDPAELGEHGVVMEEQLTEVRTYSIGTVQVRDQRASYFGTQQLTRDPRGQEVYGGSELTVQRGGFDALAAADAPDIIARCIEQARRFDAGVQACYPGFFASRRNYDVAVGRNGRGDWRCGVLEQSWRVGGATGAELAALGRLQAHPELARVRAVCVEVFGPSPEPPPGAIVHFRGEERELGFLTKYTVVESDVHAG
ncbi:DUF3182 family protein [Ramlibacter sp.]|uniref:DUF3182 family protein n=1 Tax=Ramlibacter sp. TaxID=1917967 RepID=UPI002D3C212F|nr:DUF3182 family protein [Ramlibacter sp.]HYD75058.1 DUF3182 family protein [Ramlibacter sp.]